MYHVVDQDGSHVLLRDNDVVARFVDRTDADRCAWAFNVADGMHRRFGESHRRG